MQHEPLTTITESTKDILRGYGRRDRAALAALSELDAQHWRRLATQELGRRATRIVEAMPAEALERIAASDLDMAALCRQVLCEASPPAKT